MTDSPCWAGGNADRAIGRHAQRTRRKPETTAVAVVRVRRLAALATLLLGLLWSFVALAQTANFAVSPATAPAAIMDSPYELRFIASGGSEPYTFRLIATNGSQTLSSDGVFRATPRSTFPIDFSFDVTDSAGRTSAPFAYQVTVLPPTIVVQPSLFPVATVGQPYQAQLSASGGVPPYRFVKIQGPEWMSVSADGAIGGTPVPQTGSTYANALVSVTDSFSAPVGTNGPIGPMTRFHDVTIGVNPDDSIRILPDTLPDATLGAAYGAQLSATGGVAPYSFWIRSGPLPPGLTLSTDGRLSGNTYQAGTYSFGIRAVANNFKEAYKNYTLHVVTTSREISPSTMPTGMAGVRYRQPVALVGSVSGLALLELNGRLPVGLTFAPSSGIDGIPLESGSFDFTVTATDTDGAVFSRQYQIRIAPPTLSLVGGKLPDGLRGSAYSRLLPVSGGLGPMRYRISAGALPAGMSLSEAGTLQGTPTVAGDFNFSATVVDATLGTPGQATASYRLLVYDPEIVIEPTALPAATFQQPYSATLSMTNSVAPVRFVIETGALPAGLSLSEGGQLSGAPQATGRFDFTVLGTDANGSFARRDYALSIAGLTLNVIGADFPNGVVGQPYSHTVRVSGGTAPYTFIFYNRVVFGQFFIEGMLLPAGLTTSPPAAGSRVTSADGTLTLAGIPTVIGGAFVMYSVVDSTPGAPSRIQPRIAQFQFAPPHLNIGPSPLPNAALGVPYTQALVASGGIAPYRFSLSGGALPRGIRLRCASMWCRQRRSCRPAASTP
jgi:large repetitive protein